MAAKLNCSSAWHKGGWLLISALLAGIMGSVRTPAAAQPNNASPVSLAESAAAEVLGLVNQWRMEQGLWPLKSNPTLDAMAMAQAKYITPHLASAESDMDYHIDAQGRNPIKRASQAPYNWPSYGHAAQIEIGENAAVGSPKYALDYWKNSDIHRRAALNGDYREAGVAAVPYDNKYVFIIDFGARPSVLTTLVNSAGDTLYLSNEVSTYASSFRAGSTQIRVFDAEGRPLGVTLPWQASIELTKGLHGSISVLYTNGDYQAVSRVDLAADIAILPGGSLVSKPTATDTPASETPTATQTPTSSPPPSETAAAASTLAPAATNAPLTTSTKMPPSPAPIIQPTLTPSATRSVQPDLILTYNSRSLVVYNNANKPLDLTGLSIGGGAGRITIQYWYAQASFPIEAFPAGHCLQTRLPSASDVAPKNCKFVRGLVSWPANRLFWAQGNFTVSRGDNILATCAALAGRCEVKLP